MKSIHVYIYMIYTAVICLYPEFCCEVVTLLFMWNGTLYIRKDFIQESMQVKTLNIQTCTVTRWMSIISIISNKYLSLSLSHLQSDKASVILLGLKMMVKMCKPLSPWEICTNQKGCNPYRRVCVCSHVCITSPEKSKFIFAPLA